MKKTRNKLKITGLLLTLVMLVTMLGSFGITAFAAEGAVASVTVGGTTTSYDTFDAAITAVQSCTADDEAVLTLLKEIPLGDTYQKIEGGVFTLDLNGKLLSNTDTYGWEALQVGGGAQLTIIDSGTGGTIQSATGAAVRISEGDLIVKSGTLTGRSGVSVTSDCSATINGGNIHGTEYGIYCSGTVTVYGGTVTSDTRTVYVNSGSVTINSGDFTGSHNAVYIGSNGSVTINGGSFTGGSSDFSGYGSVSMTGATFPGGITLSIITLNAALADGQAYWTGDTMLAPADGAKEITDKGDITVKAACTHDSGSKSYANNGDAHTYTYSCCNLTVTENHTYADCVCLCGADVHTFTETSNGFCTACGGYEPATLNEDTESAYYGYYEIGNAGQLMWFAELVNGGNKTANAVLTDDIDMTGIDWTPICSTGLYYGSSYASSYGDNDTGYAGTFDGNGHVIKNLSVTAIAKETWTYGLFGTMTGTVKNLGIEGFTYNHNGASDMRTGAIVGQNLGGTIENCYVVKATITPGTNVAGGITGCNYAGTIRNCYVADSNIVASSARYGYIVGDNRADTAGDRVGTIENCYTDGDLLVGSYTGTETNSKYGVNYQYFTNGGLVWYLNGQSADGIWKQGETHPNFTGTAVTQSLLSSYTEPKLENGAYQIKTESELRWFAEYVNFTDASVSAVLTDNIVMAGTDWIPIGMYGTPFTGTFDGAEKSITNFKMTITEGGRFGLFGEISGATVKNFSIDGEVTVNFPSQQTFYYGVIAVSANSTITDVHSSVNLKVEDSFDKNCIAGIVASITTTTIERCSFSGTLDIGTAYIDCAGGIVGYAGWDNTHVIRDCAFYGEIIAKHESSDKTSSGQIGGILGYYRGSNLTIANCFSSGTFDVANTTFTGMIGGRVLEMDANIGNVSNNYYYGDLPAFSNTTDDSHGYYNKDMADYEGYGDTNAAAAGEAQLVSGYVAVLLGEAWGIGENGYPIISDNQAPDSNFVIYGQQLNLGADLSMKYYVAGYAVNLDSTKLTMKFIHNGVVTVLTADPANMKDGFYVFTLTGINPQCMGDGIDAYLYYNYAEGDEPKDSVIGYTVEQNLNNLLAEYKDDAALVALIKDTLAYGETASAYRDHKTMNGTDYADNSSNKEIPASSVAASDVITNYTVRFGTANSIIIKVNPEAFGNKVFKVYCNDVELPSYGSVATNMYIKSNIAATDFDKEWTFVVRDINPTGDVYETFTLSVNDYLYAISQSTDASDTMKALAKGLYNYGVSADAYDHAENGVGEHVYDPITYKCICGAAYAIVDLASQTAGSTVDISENSVIIGDGNEYNLTLNITEDATVILDVRTSGVKLGGSINVADGKTLTLLVTGNAEHTVKDGISLGNGSNVIIEGDLTKENNKLTVTSSGGNAGIGANNGVTAGDITIRNARVDATGSSSSDSSLHYISGAGIGTANASMGNILIENSIVTAVGGYYVGSTSSDPTSHAAAIGMGSRCVAMGNITLIDSEITASNNGDGHASVIGAGSFYHPRATIDNIVSVGNMGNITITNTELNLSMANGQYMDFGAMIGSGLGNHHNYVNMGKIIFTDVTQTKLDEMIATWSIPSDFNQYGAYVLGRGYHGSLYEQGDFGGVWVSDGNGGTVQIGDESGYYDPE